MSQFQSPHSPQVIVITSGKGGVGKTTSSAAISAGLALAGHKTVVIDFDIGLRNLDLVMGCERRVIYDFTNVIRKEAQLQQALIKAGINLKDDGIFGENTKTAVVQFQQREGLIPDGIVGPATLTELGLQ